MTYLFEKLKSRVVQMRKMYGLLLLQSSRAVHKLKTRAGFTLIELMVVITIFIVVTGVLLANYPAFGSKIVLENMAYEIALAMRQAQTYGLSVRTAGADTFPGFGIHFYTGSGGDKEFFLFANDATNLTGSERYIYDGSPACVLGASTPGGDICFEHLTIDGTNSILALCRDMKKNNIQSFVDTTDVSTRSAEFNSYCEIVGSGAGLIDTLDITFTRPDPDATIALSNAGVVETSVTGAVSDAEILVVSTSGLIRTVVVYPTGQIAVE